MPQHRLLVRSQFGDYLPGDRIEDPAVMARIDAEFGDYVIREAIPEKPDVEVAHSNVAGDAEPEGERIQINDVAQTGRSIARQAPPPGMNDNPPAPKPAR